MCTKSKAINGGKQSQGARRGAHERIMVQVYLTYVIDCIDCESEVAGVRISSAVVSGDVYIVQFIVQHVDT